MLIQYIYSYYTFWYSYTSVKGGFAMRGKRAVLIIVLLTIAFLIFCWFWLQDTIDDYNIDRALTVKVDDIF